MIAADSDSSRLGCFATSFSTSTARSSGNSSSIASTAISRNGDGLVDVMRPGEPNLYIQAQDGSFTPAGSLGNVVASGVQTWDNETVGGYTFLRLSVASGKLWYIPLENVGYITATPILAPTSPDVQTPAPPK